MNGQIRPAPVRRFVIVKQSPADAFALFAGGIDRWWPRTHKIGGALLKAVVLEPREGGRWYEVDEDGSTCEWGRVLAYEPPSRLLLAWQIGADWHYDPGLVTEVEITFTPLEGGGTRVALEHRHLERFGDRADAIRDMIDAAEGGWGSILALFAERAAEG